MAIYHFSVKIIKRSEGRSAVAAAAYRSGTKLTNEWDGITHDYTKKHWIEHSEIFLPAQAKKCLGERSTLWNSVESIEKSGNAQLAREFEVAFPIELSEEERYHLVQEFIQKNLVERGMCVDLAIHNPPLTNSFHVPVDKDGNPTTDKEAMIFQNPHAHIMTTMRPLDADGNWMDKYEKSYLCRKDNEELAIPSSKIREAEAEGWQKQYRYFIGKKKVWMTSSEAEKKHLKRVDKQPKTINVPNPTVAEWNSKETLQEWRKNWADICNQYLEKNHIDARINHRSYAEQGVNLVGTVHMGVQAWQMEKQGIETDLGNLNREIKRDNFFLAQLAKKIETLEQKEKDYLEKTASRLEGLRSRSIACAYQRILYAAKFAGEEESNRAQVESATALMESINQMMKFMESLDKTIAFQKETLARTSPLQIKKRELLKTELYENEKRMEELKHRLNELKEEKQKMKIPTESEQLIVREKNHRLEELKKMESGLYKEFYALVEENKEHMKVLGAMMRGKREVYESHVEQQLREHFQEQFQADALSQAKNEAPDIQRQEKGERKDNLSYHRK